MAVGMPVVQQPLVGAGGIVVDAWHRLLIGFFQRREARAGVTVVLIDTHAIGWSSATPTGGAWKAGDVLFDPSPTVGQPYVRVCTVAGSPGTWVTGANL